MANIANNILGVEFPQRAKTIFAGAIIGLFLSKGLALIPGFSLDDYLAMNQGRDPIIFFGQGRYTEVAIQLILNNLGVSTTSIGWFSVILCIVAVATSITAGILYATRSKGPVMIQAGIAAIIGSHPYLTELFSYREAITFQAISFVLLTFIFVIIVNSEKVNHKTGLLNFIIWLTILLLVLVGTIQTTFIIALLFVFSRFIIDSMTVGGTNGIKQSLHNNAILLLTFFIAGMIYFVIFVLSQKFIATQHDPRASLITIAEIHFRLKEIAILLKHILLDNEVILSQTVKILFLAAIVGVMTKIAFTDIKIAIGCFVLFITLSLCSIFFVSISAVWWPVPRAIFGIGFSFGLTLIAMSIWLDRGQKLFFGLILTIALGQIFHSNAMLHDQLRINRWDLWTAGAIAQDLASKGVKQDQKVYLIDPDMVYPAGPKTAMGDLNVSALSTTGYSKYLMKEATGRDWDVESVAGTPEVCPRNFPLWPSPDSIQVFTQRVFVCMGHPKE
jgi:hypothetical protein